MTVQSVFGNTLFGPDDLKKVGQVFDETWEQLKSNYQDDPKSAELARERLANSVIAAYRNGEVDVVRVKAYVLYWSQPLDVHERTHLRQR